MQVKRREWRLKTGPIYNEEARKKERTPEREIGFASTQ